MTGTAKIDGADDVAATMRPANDNHRTVSEARVRTAMAARYMGQLCKHFGHRVRVERSGAEARIFFPLGVCSMQAGPTLLCLRAEAAGAAELASLEIVLGSHLARFAFRDNPEIAWTRVAGDQGGHPAAALS
jgi:hypothetical protein